MKKGSSNIQKCCSQFELQLFFWPSEAEKTRNGSKTSIFSFYSLKILEQTSKSDFFDQLFQISSPDTQDKKCCTTHELSIEWLIDRNSQDFSWQKNSKSLSKFFKKLTTFLSLHEIRLWKKFLFFYTKMSRNPNIPLLRKNLYVLTTISLT